MNKIKKGDIVVVRSGSDKKRQGKVLRILTRESHALVEGICLRKKHVKSNPTKNIPGGIVSREAFIPLSKLRLYNPATQKPDKVIFKMLENGKQVRCFKSNGEQVDKA